MTNNQWHKYPKEKPPNTGRVGVPYLVQYMTTLNGPQYDVDMWWQNTWYQVDKVLYWQEIEGPK